MVLLSRWTRRDNYEVVDLSSTGELRGWLERLGEAACDGVGRVRCGV